MTIIIQKQFLKTKWKGKQFLKNTYELFSLVYKNKIKTWTRWPCFLNLFLKINFKLNEKRKFLKASLRKHLERGSFIFIIKTFQTFESVAFYLISNCIRLSRQPNPNRLYNPRKGMFSIFWPVWRKRLKLRQSWIQANSIDHNIGEKWNNVHAWNEDSSSIVPAIQTYFSYVQEEWMAVISDKLSTFSGINRPVKSLVKNTDIRFSLRSKPSPTTQSTSPFQNLAWSLDF